AIFKKMYDALKNNGVLVTYAARGVVKRSMIEVGFTVEKLEGPPGKREMFRARKSQ
ncbi:MAG TPA: MnmC family methyltransferase, partial [Flavobacterium sp.]|uniref:MnmC family methyltransferase n=1 Tax=Flavobacterium sp. TaxID=239 RepID=UPI002F41D927